MKDIKKIMQNLARPKPWDTEPIFCFTTDIDWASEAVIKSFYDDLLALQVKPFSFLTHKSDIIEGLAKNKGVEIGIHPNFLAGSSHGNSFKEVIDNCIQLAPEAAIYRSHRAFSVTDTSHLLSDHYGYKASSNVISILSENIKPLLHESGLVEFPVFFEDGTHLYNNLELDIKPFLSKFTSPGLKIISMHPMNFVINPPTLSFMRKIKDSLSRDAFNNLGEEDLARYRNSNIGIRNLCLQIIELAQQYKVVQLSNLYDIAVN